MESVDAMNNRARFKLGHMVLRNLTELASRGDMKYRPDFVLTFSANISGEIWVFRTWGNTPDDLKKPVDDKLLRAIVKELRVVKPELGRFHLDSYGAYWGEKKTSKYRFVTFESGGDDPAEFSILRTLVHDGALSNSEKIRKYLKGS